MAVNDSTFQEFKQQDSEGFTINFARCTLANGEVIQLPAGFRHLPSNLESFDQLETRSDDIWLATYPKAGTHWVHEIIHLLVNGGSNAYESRKEAAMMELCKEIDDLNRLQSPRILNSHMRIKYLSTQVSKAQKVVHVVRNPKSIAVSYFYHTKMAERYGYSGTFHSYLPTYLHGYSTLYGNWFEYMKEWWDFAQGNKNVYFMFYEDLKQHFDPSFTLELSASETVEKGFDSFKGTFMRAQLSEYQNIMSFILFGRQPKAPETEVKKLATFLGFDYDDEFIAEIVKMTSFDAMKKGATSQPKDHPYGDKHHPSRFLRKGTIQDWKNHFTVAENEMFDEIYDKEMSNYEDLKARIRFQ